MSTNKHNSCPSRSITLRKQDLSARSQVLFSSLFFKLLHMVPPSVAVWGPSLVVCSCICIAVQSVSCSGSKEHPASDPRPTHIPRDNRLWGSRACPAFYNAFDVPGMGDNYVELKGAPRCDYERTLNLTVSGNINVSQQGFVLHVVVCIMCLVHLDRMWSVMLSVQFRCTSCG